MADAELILHMLPEPPPPVQEELALITVLRTLRKLGAHVVPAKLRLAEDRLELLEALLEGNAKLGEHAQTLVEVAALLGLSGRAVTARIEQRSAQALLEQRLFPQARVLCASLLRRNTAASWRLLYTCALADSDGDVDERLRFLAVAVAHAPRTHCVPVNA